MAHQSMSGRSAQVRIDQETEQYAVLIRNDQWTLEQAHQELRNPKLDLFKTAGLAKAIACFQCSAD